MYGRWAESDRHCWNQTGLSKTCKKSQNSSDQLQESVTHLCRSHHCHGNRSCTDMWSCRQYSCRLRRHGNYGHWYCIRRCLSVERKEDFMQMVKKLLICWCWGEFNTKNSQLLSSTRAVKVLLALSQLETIHITHKISQQWFVTLKTPLQIERKTTWEDSEDSSCV